VVWREKYQLSQDGWKFPGGFSPVQAGFQLCSEWAILDFHPGNRFPGSIHDSYRVTNSERENTRFERGSEVNDPAKNQAIIDELIKAYFMELETVLNYLANSVNLDGVRAEEIKKSLNADVTEELSHATQLANRIKTIDGVIPGSMQFDAVQATLQPPADTTDVVAVIKGVIDAEEAAIAQYEKIIRLSDGFDFVTQDMCITLLADEQQHRREFIGYLKEYEQV